MSKPNNLIKPIESLAAAHPDAQAELVRGLGHVAEDALAGHHENAVRVEVDRLSKLFPGPKPEDKE